MRKMIRAFNTGDPALVGECANKDALVSYSPHEPGTEVQTNEIRVQRMAFPDLYYQEELTIAEGDMVFLAWQSTGTHLGPLFGTDATGVRFELHGGEVARFDANNMIIEHWDQWTKPRIESHLLFGTLTPEYQNKLRAGGLL
ncbi:MAG TPA: ester cyclase [Rugosimonospora sp.]|nr:ester cyclase [Rugosimonospora sp.]